MDVPGPLPPDAIHVWMRVHSPILLALVLVTVGQHALPSPHHTDQSRHWRPCPLGKESLQKPGQQLQGCDEFAWNGGLLVACRSVVSRSAFCQAESYFLPKFWRCLSMPRV
jgi:hypothetical protein